MRSGLAPIYPAALFTRTPLSIKSVEYRLQTLRNSVNVCLLPINFLTRSKKVNSSCDGAKENDGGIGSGSAGTSVGETAGASVELGFT